MGILLIRRKLNIIQIQLSKSIGTTIQIIFLIENNKRPISVDFALRFCYYIKKVFSNDFSSVSEEDREYILKYVQSLKEQSIDKIIRFK